jgi:hypothetical protein
MSLRLPVEPWSILYDPFKDKVIVFSGLIVEDDLGQPAIFCHNKMWKDKERTSKGVIYTGWLAKKYLFKVGTL